MSVRQKTIIIVGIMLCLLALNTLRIGLGADLRANCNLFTKAKEPYPRYVSCDFDNIGFLPGRVCAAARVFYGDGTISQSREVCSGVLLPFGGHSTDRVPYEAGSLC